jgi:hypothetical protein|tara:strand:+ start:7903 stop:8085 length:183 start_codon:yes stop_codon:yes gene_type:complete
MKTRELTLTDDQVISLIECVRFGINSKDMELFENDLSDIKSELEVILRFMEADRKEIVSA